MVSPGYGPVIGRTGGNCPALLPPSANVINVGPAQAAVLDDIVQGAVPGDTILLADGLYELHGDYLWFGTPGVTMRSASGNRGAVVIDGGYETTEIVVVAASDVTIADLTLKRAKYHPIHVMSVDGANTNNTLIYNSHIIDPGQQAIKINPNTPDHYPDYGQVACSRIELTDAGRPVVWTVNGSCYTGGLDAHQARGWVVRDNEIEGFWCDQGLSEHAIHFWKGSRDTLLERNILTDNVRGVGFGLLQSSSGRTYEDNICPGADYVGHFDGIIRNNFVFQGRDELHASEYGFDCGICLAQACGARVFHNSVVSRQPPFSSIEWRFQNTQAEIINNIASHNLVERDGASATQAGNLAGAPPSLFFDPDGGDLHLVPTAGAAIDQGAPIAAGMSDDDIDGDQRDSFPDLGADENGFTPALRIFLPILRSVGH